MCTKETYTFKQAMRRLGIKSTRAFHQLQKDFPEFFVIVRQSHRVKHFDKAPIDKFAESRDEMRNFLK